MRAFATVGADADGGLRQGEILELFAITKSTLPEERDRPPQRRVLLATTPDWSWVLSRPVAIAMDAAAIHSGSRELTCSPRYSACLGFNANRVRQRVEQDESILAQVIATYRSAQ